MAVSRSPKTTVMTMRSHVEQFFAGLVILSLAWSPILYWTVGVPAALGALVVTSVALLTVMTVYDPDDPPTADDLDGE